MQYIFKMAPTQFTWVVGDHGKGDGLRELEDEILRMDAKDCLVCYNSMSLDVVLMEEWID